jgi:hypothetical protein
MQRKQRKQGVRPFSPLPHVLSIPKLASPAAENDRTGGKAQAYEED